VLENSLPGRLTIKGEISDLDVGPSGHRYFPLKDANSELRCAMWNDKFEKVKFRLEIGMAVLATGSINVYTPKGKYTFIVDELEPEGVGARQLALEQLKKKLAAEGLFDEEHKKPIPPYPQRIGILTSESGAAIEDIKDSIWNRWPCVKLFLYPVPVQGEGAAAEIARGLRDINRRNRKLKLDILIVGRGGGSMEDLWAFNEEVLARAIYNSKIPVISAVGHEVDTTIADLVADARASTPTKAGVFAVPDMQEVLGQLAYFQKRLSSVLGAKLELCRENLQTVLASAVFRNPLLPVRNREQQLDETITNLAELIRGLLAEGKDKLHRFYEQVIRLEPRRLLGNKNRELDKIINRSQIVLQSKLSRIEIEINKKTTEINEVFARFVTTSRKKVESMFLNVIRIHPGKILRGKTEGFNEISNRARDAIKNIISQAHKELTTQTGKLAGLNPTGVLKRGYSITTNKQTGLIVKNLTDIRIGDLLVTRISEENSVESKVTQKYKGRN
jgi:exodeoxyribonuclease VII large subunit